MRTRDGSETTDEHGALPQSIEDRLYALFFELPEDRRAAAIEELCAGNPDHAGEIRERALDLATSDAALGGVADEVHGSIPESIGGYRILDELGKGGFGVVYRAQQTVPVEREVAVKLLAVGTRDRAARVRFDVERRALARMRHDGIASVLDADTDTPTGRPYVVMELVDGEAITCYCDRLRRDVRQRLRLFVRVCSAVHHAHQKGILHRDLKPSNVLVRTVDDRDVPKIIDFGIAKLIDEAGEAGPQLTVAGGFVGTPDYASPEQLAGRELDTRSDVYSLGVVLFELLAGRHPFAYALPSRVDLVSRARLVDQTEPQALGRALNSGGEPDKIAADRDTTADNLQRTLRDDLEVIVATALARDPERRYDSAAALGADIDRYLRNLPIAARKPSRRYLLRKFAARHRIGVAASALVLITIVVGWTGTAWSLAEIADARRVAEERRVQTEASLYATSVRNAQLLLGEDDGMTARRVLERAPAHLRGWEWDYLWGRTNQALSSFPVTEPSERTIVTLGHRRGDELFVGVEGGGISVFDLDGELLRVLEEYSGHVNLLVVPEREFLVTAANGYGIELWDLKTEARTRLSSPGLVHLSRDTQLTASDDRRLLAWASGRFGQIHDLEDPGAERGGTRIRPTPSVAWCAGRSSPGWRSTWCECCGASAATPAVRRSRPSRSRG